MLKPIICSVLADNSKTLSNTATEECDDVHEPCLAENELLNLWLSFFAYIYVRGCWSGNSNLFQKDRCIQV